MRLHGSITALATPFDASGQVDFDAWRGLLVRQIDGGTQGVVVAGSTGEAAMLADEEYVGLVRSAVALVAGRIPVLAGAGQSGTDRTIRQCHIARDAGADAALVVTPPYVRPTQDGLGQHFEAVADNAGLPVVLYNVPGRTGCDLLPETCARLAPHANIVGIKEARADGGRIAALLPLRGPGFVVLSGDDPTACDALLAGADGVISVLSNLVPRAFRALCDAARAGDVAAAAAIDAELASLCAFTGIESNPIPTKALLAQLRLCTDALRLPLLPLSTPHRTRLAELAAFVVSTETRHVRALAA